MAIVTKETVCRIFLVSLLLAGCKQYIVQDIPDRCPITLNTYASYDRAYGNVIIQWTPAIETILFRFSSLYHPHGWYLASLDTNLIESFLADSRWKDELQWVAWSPTEDIVVFTHGGPNLNDTSIYRFDAHSHDVTRLVEGGGGVLLWSSDGRQIAFRKDTDLHVMDTDGKNVRPLAGTSEVFLEMWHPSKAKILVLLSGDIGNRPDSIGVLDVDSGDITQLTDTKDCEFHLRWSPDGQQIAYVSRDRNQDIFVMDADGSNVVNLTNTTPEHERDFSWSPDGHQIVFTRYHATSIEEFSQEIYVMNADGSAQRSLTSTSDEHEFAPLWSPDGEQIAFWSTGQIGEGADSRWWRLNVMHADGSARRTLATFAAEDGKTP